MKQSKKILIESDKITSITCNKCGLSVDFGGHDFQVEVDFTEIDHMYHYASKKDGDHYSSHVCEACMEVFYASFVIPPTVSEAYPVFEDEESQKPEPSNVVPVVNRIIPANICTALQTYEVIGSKVTGFASFMRELHAAVAAHDFTSDRIPGQAFLAIPSAIPYVSCGVGKPVPTADAYVLRSHRGKVSAFLKREHAAPVESLHCVVYTKEAYLSDPDITSEEAARISSQNQVPITHLLVAVLASAGPQSQLGPYRFTANLAGGNREAQVWTADEIRAKASAIMSYDNEWQTVAD